MGGGLIWLDWNNNESAQGSDCDIPRSGGFVKICIINTSGYLLLIIYQVNSVESHDSVFNGRRYSFYITYL